MCKPALCILLFALSTSLYGQETDVEALVKLNKAWIDSFVTKDTATMRSIYADDMILVSPNGKVFNKHDLLSNLISPNSDYISTKVDSVSVRLLSNVGLVRATVTAIAKDKQGKKKITTCYLDVYEKRKGRWYAVASQVAMINIE